MDGLSPRLLPFVAMAGVIATAIPERSAAALATAVKTFTAFLEWVRFTGPPAVEPLVGFIVARCAPPVGVDLPDGFVTPVLPTTAVAGVDALRRASRLGVESMVPWRAALDAEALHAFCSAVGGRVHHLRSQKRPFLFQMVARAVTMWGCGTMLDRRNAAAIVVGFFFGCRASELAALQRGDVSVLDSGVVRVVFRARKNCRSVLGLHDPQRIVGRHALLHSVVTGWLRDLDGLGATSATPLFPAMRGGGGLRPLAPAAFREIVRRVDPGCVAHSLRVGLATEAWAAGVPIEAIMALGGWTSPVALMYVIGANEETVHASARLGSAQMRFDGDGLHAQLGTARLQRATWMSRGMMTEGAGSDAVDGAAMRSGGEAW
jgi:integrase